MPDFDRVTAIFTAALERRPAERRALLDAECGGDAELRAEVESLLAAEERAGRFLEVPAAVATGLAEPEPEPLSRGSNLGPYRIEREIGRGGMGVVYLAEDTRLGRKVAVKMLAPEFTRDERRRERVRLEARAAAALAHPGIATVYSLEEIGPQVCLVFEYVPGETLRAELERGPLPSPLLLDTAVQLAQALGAAHAAGVVHRDIKPENVIRGADGRVRILDFGVARSSGELSAAARRLTDPGVLIGTPAYMSPEQLDGADVDARSDIFALGVLLFELASGSHPFDTRTPASTAARVLSVEPPDLRRLNPAIPAGLEAVIGRCLRKDPGERYQSAEAVSLALDAIRSGRSIPDAAVVSRRRAAADTLTAHGWWVVHQAAAMAVAAIMVWPVAAVDEAVGSSWTLGLLLGVIAAVAANGTLRAHLLFTSRFNRADLGDQLARTEHLLRAADWLLAVLLLASAVPTARSHTVLSAVLAAVSLGWMITSLVIEPSTRRAAFPR